MGDTRLLEHKLDAMGCSPVAIRSRGLTGERPGRPGARHVGCQCDDPPSRTGSAVAIGPGDINIICMIIQLER